MSWAENSLFVIGRDMYSGVKEHDERLLGEAVVGAEALYEIAQELHRRTAL